MTDFSVNDGPLIRRALKGRWNMSERLKDKCIKIAEEALDAEELPLDEKRKFIDTLAKLDTINLKEEALFTPKVLLHGDIKHLKNEDLEAKSRELERQLKQLEQANKPKELPKEIELEPFIKQDNAL